ncbi:MAG: PilZ domain-containing protein [Alteripontixanthobacter sp.]
MNVGAQLSVTDMRRASRCPIDYPVIAEHHDLGDVKMHLCNISANGFMVDDAQELERGQRVIVRLPVVGRIEAHVMWQRDKRAGLQFERIIRLDDFLAMIEELQPNPKLRRQR